MTIALLCINAEDEDILQTQAATLSGEKRVVQQLTADDARNYSHIVCASSAQSRDILSVLGAQLDAQPITDVTQIIDADNFIRPIYAGNALATVQSTDPVKLISVRAGRSGKANASKDLRHASVVIGGGRPFGERFSLAHELADTLGGAVGATRAAVDAGYIGNDAQIGQTGKTIAPALYIACAISGAIQHVGGIRNAGTVIAINNDPAAPIFRHATYGYVGDVFEVVPQLIKRLNS